ncbi:hypothetical protein [Streptomyces carpaticus]|uniref:Uncharacterized protein n=1 Tax=Streptomyces carpaticus TaxID=285558 RepID=A0ABV4ZUF1_9ACTN
MAGTEIAGTVTADEHELAAQMLAYLRDLDRSPRPLMPLRRGPDGTEVWWLVQRVVRAGAAVSLADSVLSTASWRLPDTSPLLRLLTAYVEAGRPLVPVADRLVREWRADPAPLPDWADVARQRSESPSAAWWALAEERLADWDLVHLLAERDQAERAVARMDEIAETLRVALAS